MTGANAMIWKKTDSPNQFVGLTQNAAFVTKFYNTFGF
jgi:hypothetical protein